MLMKSSVPFQLHQNFSGVKRRGKSKGGKLKKSCFDHFTLHSSKRWGKDMGEEQQAQKHHQLTTCTPHCSKKWGQDMGDRKLKKSCFAYFITFCSRRWAKDMQACNKLKASLVDSFVLHCSKKDMGREESNLKKSYFYYLVYHIAPKRWGKTKFHFLRYTAPFSLYHLSIAENEGFPTCLPLVPLTLT